MWQLVPEEGDRFLLCSDGLTNEVPADQIADVLVETRDPREAAEALVQMANQAGGNDNVTVVVLDVMVGETPVATAVPSSATTGASGRPGVAGVADDAAATAAPAGSTRVVSAPESGTPPPTDGPGVGGVVTTNGVGAAVVSRSAPEEVDRRPAGRRSPRRAAVPRRITFRVVLFLIVLGGLAYAGYATVRWYVNSSYFVGLNHDHVVIYQGRPGGFVGINPKIVNHTRMTTDQVQSFKLPDLHAGVQEPSKKAAQNYVRRSCSRCAAWTIRPPTATASPPRRRPAPRPPRRRGSPRPPRDAGSHRPSPSRREAA